MATEKLRRKLAAILYADVVGYSRLTGENEDATHHRLSKYLDLATKNIRTRNGKVVHFAGDAILAEFATASEAVIAALAIQRQLKTENENVSVEQQLLFRIGVNLGEVIVDRNDLYGDGVNIAARLEGLAQPGGVCISESVRTSIGNKLAVEYEYLGDKQVKNIIQSVKAYNILVQADTELPSPKKGLWKPQWLEGSQPNRPFFYVLLLTVLGAIVVTTTLLTKYSRKSITNQAESTTRVSILPTIAVLPFDSIGDDSLDYLSRGISEGIIFALSRSPHIQIIPRTSSFRFNSDENTAQQFSKNIGADYALEGTIQKGSDSVRVISQLLEVDTGFQLWAESFDQETDDALAIQDTVSEKIMGSLVDREDGAFRHIVSKKAWLKERMDLEEYDYMLRGHDYHLRWSKENVAQALSIYEEGLQQFPNSALLRAKIGWALYAQATQGWSSDPETLLVRATTLAEEAIAQDKAPLISDYLAHRLLGWLYAVSGQQVERGLEEMEEAVSLVPGIGRARADLGSIQLFAGHIDEGMENLDAAQLTDPGYPRIALYKAWGYRMKGEYRKALIEAERFGIESTDKYLLLASNYQGIGETEKAKASVAKALSINPDLSIDETRKLLAFTNAEFVEQYLEDLRQAGLKEQGN